MAHHKSAKKRIRTNARKHERNQAALSKVRTLVKKVHGAETKADAETILKEAISYIDKTAGKGRIHKNRVFLILSSLF